VFEIGGRVFFSPACLGCAGHIILEAAGIGLALMGPFWVTYIWPAVRVYLLVVGLGSGRRHIGSMSVCLGRLID
jgi:hypothetical protein